MKKNQRKKNQSIDENYQFLTFHKRMSMLNVNTKRSICLSVLQANEVIRHSPTEFHVNTSLRIFDDVQWMYNVCCQLCDVNRKHRNNIAMRRGEFDYGLLWVCCAMCVLRLGLLFCSECISPKKKKNTKTDGCNKSEGRKKIKST